MRPNPGSSSTKGGRHRRSAPTSEAHQAEIAGSEPGADHQEARRARFQTYCRAADLAGKNVERHEANGHFALAGTMRRDEYVDAMRTTLEEHGTDQEIANFENMVREAMKEYPVFNEQSGYIEHWPRDDEKEEAALQTFGRPADQTVNSEGLHWHWPSPIGQVHVWQTGKNRTAEIGYFRLPEGRLSALTNENWTRDLDAATMITGDLNLIEVQAVAQYRISDPNRWFCIICWVVYHGRMRCTRGMGHLCGSTCKRKTGAACQTCRTAENMEKYFGRETGQMSVCRWVRELSGKSDEILRPMKVNTGDSWVADEMVVNVGCKKYWLFNVMDSETRFVLAAYLSPVRTSRAAATALSLARERAENHPAEIKTDGLKSYREALPRAFPTRPVKHIVSKGIRAEINNMSERLQGTFRDRDKTLRGLKARETGQVYIDGLVTHYNFFRPHESLDGKRTAKSPGTEIPFQNWEDVAAAKVASRNSAEWRR